MGNLCVKRKNSVNIDTKYPVTNQSQPDESESDITETKHDESESDITETKHDDDQEAFCEQEEIQINDVTLDIDSEDVADKCPFTGDSSGYVSAIPPSNRVASGIDPQVLTDKLLPLEDNCTTNTDGHAVTEVNTNERDPDIADVKPTIISKYTYLRENIIAKELCTYLERDGVLGESERQHILHEISMSDKADMLLQTLLQKKSFGPVEYGILLDALKETDNTYIVEELNKANDSKEDECLKDEVEEYAKECIEENLDKLADQLEPMHLALECLERGVISIEDYASVFNIRKVKSDSAKLLLMCVSKIRQELFHVFIKALKETDCSAAVRIFEQYQHSSPGVKHTGAKVEVNYQNGTFAIKGIDQLPDGLRIEMTLCFDNKQVEAKMVEKLKPNNCEIDLTTVKTMNGEIESIEFGSVIIRLKLYNDKGLKELLEAGGDKENLCKLIRCLLLQSKVTHLLSPGNTLLKMKIRIDNTKSTCDKKQTTAKNMTLCQRCLIRRRMIREELNPKTYAATLPIDDKEQFELSIKGVSRSKAMYSLMTYTLKDENMCKRFLEHVEKNENKDFYERLLWFGTRDELVTGILDNYEYLLDELLPRKILRAMGTTDFDARVIQSLVETLAEDRRSCVISLLKHVLGGRNMAVEHFYDALCSTDHFEIADRIRKSAEVLSKESDKGNSVHLSTRDNTPVTVFEGEFCICITHDPQDYRVGAELTGTHMGLTETSTVTGVGTNNKTHLDSGFSVVMLANDSRSFTLTPLDAAEEATVSATIYNDNPEVLINIVSKRKLSGSETVSINLSSNYVCTVDSSFDASVPQRELQNIKQIKLDLRGCNLQITENQYLHKKPDTYRSVKQLKRKRRSELLDNDNSRENNDKDDDEGYPESTMSSCASAANQSELKQMLEANSNQEFFI